MFPWRRRGSLFLVLHAALPLALLLAGTPACAQLTLRDDAGTAITLPAPARRIVSLAPHVTEMLYAAGAGDRIVGAVEFSNYPAAAERLPRIGSYASFDAEAIAALKPDLAIGWDSGNPPAAVAQLRKLGIPVFMFEPRTIDDVGRDLLRYGELAGVKDQAAAAAARFTERHAALQKKYAGRRPVTVFYEVWQEPLMTVNGRQIISDVIRLCGGANVFADLPALAPTISVEAVLAANPEAVVAGGMGERNAAWLDQWRRWPKLNATAKGNLFFIDPNLLQRHTPRLLDGAEIMCKQLDEARQRKP